MSYDLISISAATLYAGTGIQGTAGLAQQPGGQYRGYALAIDDSSTIPDCTVWLENEGIGLPLCRGQILRRPFKGFRVAPASPSTLPGLASLPVGSTSGVQLSPGSLVLRAYREEPGLIGPAAPMSSVEQSALTIVGAGTAEPILGWARIPGAKQVTLWATNENQANAAAATLNLYTVRPQVNGGAVATTIRLGKLLGSATLPAAADSGKRVEVSIYYPGVYEVAWSLALPVTTGNYFCTSGAEVTYA